MNTQKLFATVMLILAVFVLSIPALFGTDYYVSPTGSDSNPGTEAQPWKTIQKAANTLVAGDSVYIMAGTYSERVIPANSGTAIDRITYAAYPTHLVTIDGTGVNVPSWGGLFDLSDRSYITVTGLRVVDSESAGIFADNGNNLIIQNNYTYNTYSSGIGIWNSNTIAIDGNEVVLACNDGDQECITVATTDTFEIKNNHVHNSGPGTNGGEGIDAKDGSSNGTIHNNTVHNINRLGIYVDSWDKHTFNIDVYANKVYNTTNDGFAVAAEAGGLLENVRIFNNIAYNNSLNGVTVSTNGTSPNHPMNNIQIINNTFYDNGTAVWGGGISLENNDAQNVIVRNNICSQNYTYQINAEVPAALYTAEYNLIDGYRGYNTEIRGENYQEGTPSFVNAAAADFHLQANSLAIGNATATGAPGTDFDGVVRPQGGGYDIGAFEYVPTCMQSLDPTGATYGESGGSGSVNVNAEVGCMWTATSNATWITITGGGSGNGSGTVNYSVDPNTGFDRIGTISVSGLTFTVTQTGAIACLYCDDFEDGNADDWWSYGQATWGVSGGDLQGTTVRKSTAIAPWSGASEYTIEADLRIDTPYGRASIIGWYQAKATNVEIRLMDDRNKVLLKHKASGLIAAKKSAPINITPGTNYHVAVTYNAGEFHVTVNGQLLINTTTLAAPYGGIGFRIKSTTGLPTKCSLSQIGVY